MSGIILTLWHNTNETATPKSEVALLKSLVRWKSDSEQIVDILLLRLLAVTILMTMSKMSVTSMFHNTNQNKSKDPSSIQLDISYLSNEYGHSTINNIRQI